MTITRIVPGVVLVVAAAAGTADAQFGVSPPRAGGSYRDRLPSVVPAGPTMPEPPPSALERGATTPGLASPTPHPTPDPSATPLGQATAPAAAGLPPGSYPSPYYTDGPGCCGPLGRDGRIGYELYAYTGPTWALGEGRFARQLNPGWMVGGGGRSLFFNPTHDAAWVLDLGVSFQYNHGEPGHLQDLFIRVAPERDFFGNIIRVRPDELAPTAIKALNRTNFNFAIGRDWWLWGPGSTGTEAAWNLRVGGLVGGRWGTAHVDLHVNGDPQFYQRRQGVTHGVFVAPQASLEVPLGSWILFGGLRFEWGYDWTNLVPPIQGNLHNLNLLMTAGVRY